MSATLAARRGRLATLAARHRGRLGTAVTLAAPAAIAALLTAYELSTRSLWLDEGATVAIASQHGAALWHAIAHDGGNMLAYYLLLHAVIGAFGDAAAVIRFPSVVAAAATATIVAALGLRLTGGDRRVAGTAAALTAVSLPLVFWGQDARGYALMVTFTAGSFLGLAALLSTPPAGIRASSMPLLAFAGSLLLALYIGFDAVVIIPAQLLLLLRFRDHARAVLGALAAVALLCVPLLVLAIGRGSSQLFWVAPATWHVLGQTLVVLSSAGLAPNFHHTPLTTVATIATGAAFAATVWTGWRRRPAPWQLWLLAAWLLVPAALAVAASLAGAPVELQRLAILLIPALSLLLAWGAWRAPMPAGAAWAGVIALVALRLAVLVPTYGVSPEPWKAATRYVLAQTARAAPPSGVSGRACIAFYPQDGRMPFHYYLAGRTTASLTPVLPSAAWGRAVPYVESYLVPAPAVLAAIVRRCPALWLVAAHEGQASGPPASRADAERYGRLAGALAARYPHEQLRKFGWAAQIRVQLFTR